MRIINCNVNGIRSATAKGFWDWFTEQDADVLCLQELKAHEQQLPEASLCPAYHRYYHFATKPGYSGVALYSRNKPDQVHIGLGSIDPDFDWAAFDTEGRFVMADFDKLSIISVYFPSGSSKSTRQAAKMSFLEGFLPLMQRLQSQGRDLIVCGDMNIAHQRIDLKNWRGNQKNSGFLPEERAWFSSWLDSGFVDVLRHLHPDAEIYSWWSNRGQARDKDVGWRIDYHICTRATAQCARQAKILDRKHRFSDHAPIIADFSGFEDL